MLPLELIEAGFESRPVLENLLQLYIHDFSELVAVDVEGDGRYRYERLALYWGDPTRFPFLAKLGGKLAGFALVTRLPENDGVYDMAEFFVLRRYRRCGVGRALAEKIWLRCPGLWQIRVRADNEPALEFWSTSVARFTRELPRPVETELDGTEWIIFSFDSGS